MLSMKNPSTIDSLLTQYLNKKFGETDEDRYVIAKVLICDRPRQFSIEHTLAFIG